MVGVRSVGERTWSSMPMVVVCMFSEERFVVSLSANKGNKSPQCEHFCYGPNQFRKELYRKGQYMDVKRIVVGAIKSSVLAK